MAIQARKSAEGVVAVFREIETDGEMIDSGLAQRQGPFLRHLRPVRYQDRVRRRRAALNRADDLRHVVAHQRLAAGNLYDARPQRVHMAAILGGTQVARLIARAAVVAMLAITRARVGYFK